jgi:hypothetical protein
MTDSTMPRLIASALATILLLPAGPAAAQQTLSDKICAAARAHLRNLPAQPLFATFLASANFRKGDWTQVSPGQLAAKNVANGNHASALYMAYIRPTHFDAAGALSVRIAIPAEGKVQPTNEVEIYRPAIAPGLNRCEPRGRKTIDRSVRVNQYIDYHARGAANSSLEDFHFAYPVQTRTCFRTDRTQRSRDSHLFEDVRPTQGDSFFGRNFRFITPAYAIGHTYASLRSELHYRPSAQLGVSCVGFKVALTDAPAKVRVHEHGFYTQWLLGRGSLDVQR